MEVDLITGGSSSIRKAPRASSTEVDSLITGGPSRIRVLLVEVTNYKGSLKTLRGG